jgi:hypothetical protein
VTYPAIAAAVFGLSWPSLRRWLPRRLGTSMTQKTLGSPRGSLLWLTILVPAVVASVGEAALVHPPSAPPTPVATASAPVCRDRTRLDAFGTPLHAAEVALSKATKETVVAVFMRRTRVARSAAERVAGYEPATKWGAEMKAQLVGALRRTIRADRAYLHRRIPYKKWRAEYRDLSRVADDLFKPVC